MDRSMDSNVELINEAIKKLLEEMKNNRGGLGDEEDQILLSRLLSQLESLKADSIIHRDDDVNSGGGETGAGGGGGERDRDELAKELREVKRQNTITHWLLSVLIVLTVAWQASEVTMLWKVKQGLSNPFKYVGSLVGGIFKGGSGDLSPLEARDKHHQNEAITALKMPELPSVELPDICLDGEKH